MVGNFGVAVISASIDAPEDAWLVTETSSFQLETTKYFKPAVSAILNLTPDHLDRHHTMEAYGAAKAMIIANQQADGHTVLNADDPACIGLAGKNCKAKVVPFSRTKKLDFGAYVEDDQIVIRNEEGQLITFCGTGELQIIGSHNLENALAAAAVSYFAGIDPAVIADVLRTIGGVEHRIEYCGMVDGVKYYNDSKGTNVDAAVTALRAFGKNIILIAGGDGKGQEFDSFLAGFNGSVKHMLLLGKDAPLLHAAADNAGFADYSLVKDMDEAVRKAYDMAVEGDTVLLSPACASWDMYKNYEQRGDHFKECVERLQK